MTMRTVSIHKAELFDEAVDEIPYRQRQMALGHLSLWAIGNEKYTHCSILLDNDGNMIARYSKEPDGDLAYSILAQVDHKSRTYSFHS